MPDPTPPPLRELLDLMERHEIQLPCDASPALLWQTPVHDHATRRFVADVMTESYGPGKFLSGHGVHFTDWPGVRVFWKDGEPEAQATWLQGIADQLGVPVEKVRALLHEQVSA